MTVTEASQYTKDTYHIFVSVYCSANNIYYVTIPNINL